MRIIHYDDKKEKGQSHEVKLNIEPHKPILGIKYNIYSYDITDIVGYGATKEEAFEDYKEKINVLTKFYNRCNEKLQNANVEDLEDEN